MDARTELNNLANKLQDEIIELKRIYYVKLLENLAEDLENASSYSCLLARALGVHQKEIVDEMNSGDLDIFIKERQTEHRIMEVLIPIDKPSNYEALTWMMIRLQEVAIERAKISGNLNVSLMI